MNASDLENGRGQIRKKDPVSDTPFPFRVVPTGWLGDRKVTFDTVRATPEELREANDTLAKVEKLARFGDQQQGFSIARTSEAKDNHPGTFIGVTYPGRINGLHDIDLLEGFTRKHWNELYLEHPDVDWFSWVRNLFDYPGDGPLPDYAGRDTDPIRIVRYRRRDPNDQHAVMSCPADDTPYASGIPPYRKDNRRTPKGLLYVRFNTPASKFEWEERLLTHPNPVRHLNALFSIFLSPGVLSNLIGVDKAHTAHWVVKDGKPQSAFYQNDDEALRDLAGLSFSVTNAIDMGMNSVKKI